MSRINCEKLKLTDGNSLNFSISSSWISSRVILRVQISWPKNLIGFSRHCSIGISGALNSRLKKLVTSVPSSGRPTCDITPLISGIEPITSRSRGAIRAASSSVTVRGRKARIQRFPSSSGGMNSPPSLGISVIVNASSTPIAARSR